MTEHPGLTLLGSAAGVACVDDACLVPGWGAAVAPADPTGAGGPNSEPAGGADRVAASPPTATTDRAD